MSPATILLLLLVLVPLTEIAVFIQVGGLIGLWPTLALTVITTVIGAFCIRIQGFRHFNQARLQMGAGEAPVFEVISGVCALMAGILLIMPGFVTDALGLALLLPQVRRLFYQRFLAHRMTVMRDAEAAAAGAGPHGGSGPEHARAGRPQPGRPVVIEGEFEPIDDNRDDMPPPRGGWDKPS